MIILLLFFVGVADAGGSHIADVQSIALSLPDQLPVLLQRQPIAT